jgi:hypothetical protein
MILNNIQEKKLLLICKEFINNFVRILSKNLQNFAKKIFCKKTVRFFTKKSQIFYKFISELFWQNLS